MIFCWCRGGQNDKKKKDDAPRNVPEQRARAAPVVSTLGDLRKLKKEDAPLSPRSSGSHGNPSSGGRCRSGTMSPRAGNMSPRGVTSADNLPGYCRFRASQRREGREGSVSGGGGDAAGHNLSGTIAGAGAAGAGGDGWGSTAVFSAATAQLTGGAGALSSSMYHQAVAKSRSSFGEPAAGGSGGHGASTTFSSGDSSLFHSTAQMAAAGAARPTKRTTRLEKRSVRINVDDTTCAPGDFHKAPIGAEVMFQTFVKGSWLSGVVAELHPDGTSDILCAAPDDPSGDRIEVGVAPSDIRDPADNYAENCLQGRWHDGAGNVFDILGKGVRETSLEGVVGVHQLTRVGKSGLPALDGVKVYALTQKGVVWQDGSVWRRKRGRLVRVDAEDASVEWGESNGEVSVASVAEDAAVQLRKGDVLHSVNGVAVSTLESFMRYIVGAGGDGCLDLLIIDGEESIAAAQAALGSSTHSSGNDDAEQTHTSVPRSPRGARGGGGLRGFRGGGGVSPGGGAPGGGGAGDSGVIPLTPPLLTPSPSPAPSPTPPPSTGMGARAHSTNSLYDSQYFSGETERQPTERFLTAEDVQVGAILEATWGGVAHRCRVTEVRKGEDGACEAEEGVCKVRWLFDEEGPEWRVMELVELTLPDEAGAEAAAEEDGGSRDDDDLVADELESLRSLWRRAVSAYDAVSSDGRQEPTFTDLVTALHLTKQAAKRQLRALARPGTSKVPRQDFLTWMSHLAESGMAEATLSWVERNLAADTDDHLNSSTVMHLMSSSPLFTDDCLPLSYPPTTENVLVLPGRGRVVGDCGSVARAGELLTTEEVGTLDSGAVVDVAEVQGRRARLIAPLKGWVSLTTAEGNVLIGEHPVIPSVDECDLVRCSDEPCGLTWSGLRLEAVTAPEGSAACRGCFRRLVGRSLVTVDGHSVPPGTDVAAALAGRTNARLGFAPLSRLTGCLRKKPDEALGMAFSAHCVLTAVTEERARCLEKYVGKTVTHVDGVPVHQQADIMRLSAGGTATVFTFTNEAPGCNANLPPGLGDSALLEAERSTFIDANARGSIDGSDDDDDKSVVYVHPDAEEDSYADADAIMHNPF
eukprot:Rhum_TRINITY_DN14252_c0_g2::Rhum_TRINITY_DN14252_c0_g2_i1::g.75476::m.75476